MPHRTGCSNMPSVITTALLLFAQAAFGAETFSVGLDIPARAHHAVQGKDARQILLIAGLDGQPAPLLEREIAAIEKSRGRYALTVIGTANPRRAALSFPPPGDAYRDNPESHTLWRWIGATAPDLVLILGPDPGNLKAALETISPLGIGRVPVRALAAPGELSSALKRLPEKSAARKEVERRLSRTPRQVAELLSKHYGHELEEAVYIPAFALIGRLRLGHTAAVESITAPFVTGAKDSLAKPTSSHFSGHLLFAELAAHTRNPRYTELVRKAAGFAFAESGEMKESMPLHNQMSDSVFMGCPILAQAGKLTGERRYFDMALRHFRFMRKLDLRADGLWRHSPLDEAAWGRGNAFALLGMALTLDALPKDHEGFGETLREYRNHAAALLARQESLGMWRQVVDNASSYRELSATAMIGRALRIGVRRGWLEAASYRKVVDAAWRAVSARTADDGQLIDVCESTGAQKSLRDYLNRKANLGLDARGGAMVMLFALEMAE